MKSQAKSMKNQTKLMKTIDSSDINPMVWSSMNIASVRPGMPVSTSAIWGMLALENAEGTDVSSAIWGTSAMSGPMLPVPRPSPSVVRSS